jgi:beta-galactosidase
VATAPLLPQLAVRHRTDTPLTFERMDLPQGLALYRTRVPAGPAATLHAPAIHDFAWVSLDGKAIGVVDRRHPGERVEVPARSREATLELLVYAMGRINFGPEIHDRKGIQGPVTLKAAGGGVTALTRWEIAPLPLDVAPRPGAWQPVAGGAGAGMEGPRLWRFEFNLESPADTFLDLSTWGKGVVWLNGQALGRFWNVGPTQSLYAPAPWFRKGRNEVVILDLLGPEQALLTGRTRPILDQLRPTADFNRPKGFGRFVLNSVRALHEGEFAPGSEPQEVRLDEPVEVRQFGLESLSSHDGGSTASVAELELLDATGAPLPQDHWTIAYVGSEELAEEDGSAVNAINGQTADGWCTASDADAPAHPHRLVIDLGGTARVGGFRYTPRQGGDDEPGRIKTYRVYLGDELATLKAN